MVCGGAKSQIGLDSAKSLDYIEANINPLRVEARNETNSSDLSFDIIEEE